MRVRVRRLRTEGLTDREARQVGDEKPGKDGRVVQPRDSCTAAEHAKCSDALNCKVYVISCASGKRGSPQFP